MPCSTSSTRRLPPAVDSAHSRSCSLAICFAFVCSFFGSPLFFVGASGRPSGSMSARTRPALANASACAHRRHDPRSTASAPVVTRARRSGRVADVTALRVWAPKSRGLPSSSTARARRSNRPATAGGPDRSSRRAPTTPSSSTTRTRPVPDPASRWQPDGVHGPSRVYDQQRYTWHDTDWAGRDLPGAVIYELHIGTFTEGAHVRLGDRAARPPRRPRHHPRRGAADQRGERHVELGLRRRRLVRRARAARRTGRLQALRRRRARARPRRRARRRLQPPRPVRQLPAALRSVPEDRTQHLGRSGQRRGAGRPQLHHRERADVAARLPRRRAAPRCRARACRTRHRSTSSPNWPSAPRRCRPRSAGRSR